MGKRKSWMNGHPDSRVDAESWLVMTHGPRGSNGVLNWRHFPAAFWGLLQSTMHAYQVALSKLICYPQSSKIYRDITTTYIINYHHISSISMYILSKLGMYTTIPPLRVDIPIVGTPIMGSPDHVLTIAHVRSFQVLHTASYSSVYFF